MGIRVGDQFARDGRGCERRSLVIEYGSLVVMRNPSSRYLKRFFEKILHSEVASAPKDGLQLVLHPQGCNCLPL